MNRFSGHFSVLHMIIIMIISIISFIMIIIIMIIIVIIIIVIIIIIIIMIVIIIILFTISKTVVQSVTGITILSNKQTVNTIDTTHAHTCMCTHAHIHTSKVTDLKSSPYSTQIPPGCLTSKGLIDHTHEKLHTNTGR